MEQKNLDKAMSLYAKLITGEAVSRQSNRELYDAYSSNAEVFDILDAALKHSNLTLVEYKNALYVTAGDHNRIFGFTNEELKRAIGLRLNRELFLAYLVIYDIMTLFYEDTGAEPAVEYIQTAQVIDSTDTLLAGAVKNMGMAAMTEDEQESFTSIAMLWDGLPLVTESEDLSTLKAARGSKTGFVKLVFNFLMTQQLFIEVNGRYYAADRFKALIENYFDNEKGRLYALINQPSGQA